jgi:UDP-N-acetylglucosamine 2-epimerase (non-hydrolysing)
VEALLTLLETLEIIARRLPVIFPAHPRTRERLAALGTQNGRHRGLRIIPPLGYLDFLCLLSKAVVVLTDSGGIQEETTALGVPCLTLREIPSAR